MLELKSNILYKEVVLDHYKNPRNKGLVDDLKIYNISNPTCGDTLNLQIEFDENNKIKKIHHLGSGCSISMASASVLSETLVGMTKTQAKVLINNYINIIKGQEYDKELHYKDAIYFKGVSEYPARFKCASMSWEAVLNILNEK